jgi:peptidoglycan/LPS O-acetylase OafA/YrhL
MLYLDAFYEPLFNRAPIGVLWTLAIEFWLSLLIPFFVYVFQKISGSELFLLATFVISSLGPVLLLKFGVGDLMAWKSLPASVFCFAVGSYLSTLEKSEHSAKAFRLMLIFSIGFTLMYLWGGYMGSWWVTILGTSSYLGYRRTSEVSSKPSNALLVWLGTICYGVYLIHMPVLASFGTWGSNWAFYPALVPVLFLSSLSWLLVEKPISRFGRQRPIKVPTIG